MGVAGAPSAFTEELRGNLGLWGARDWGGRNASRRKGLPVRSPGARVLQDPPLGPENFFHRRHFCSEVASSQNTTGMTTALLLRPSIPA